MIVTIRFCRMRLVSNVFVSLNRITFMASLVNSPLISTTATMPPVPRIWMLPLTSFPWVTHIDPVRTAATKWPIPWVTRPCSALPPWVVRRGVGSHVIHLGLTVMPLSLSLHPWSAWWAPPRTRTMRPASACLLRQLLFSWLFHFYFIHCPSASIVRTHQWCCSQ